jgi:hypothetical protein
MELDASMLRPIVGHALDAAVAVPIEWSVVPILAGDGQGLGVFRVSGSARVGGEPRAWSVILKVLPATPGPRTAWNYPAREALAYEQGLLDNLPPGLGAPRCFGHAKHGGQHNLWLEDLGSDAIRWRLDDYGEAARALGRFNGAYLTGRSLPWVGGSAGSGFAPAGRGCRRGARASSLPRAPACAARISTRGPRSPASAVGASSRAPRRA